MSALVSAETGPEEDIPLDESPLEPVPRRLTLFRFMIAGVIGAGSYAAWTFLADPVQATVPDELIGYWRSSSKQYDDRYLYFAPHAVALGRGAVAESEGFPVESVQSAREGTDRGITVVYRQHDGTRDQLHLVYHAATRTLSFKNQPALQWKKHWSKG